MSERVKGSLRLAVLLYFVAVLFAGPGLAADTVCAKAGIDVRQELTLERQGFDAHMGITNALTDPLECPDCGGSLRIVAFIGEPRVARAILEHLSLWDERRPPPALPAAGRAAVELEYLPWVE